MSGLALALACLLPAQPAAKDIFPLLRARCQGCHRPGTAAPFALRTPADAAPWAASIREAVAGGRMPPWHADPRYGRFANDRGLTPAEREALLSWADAGCPPGEGDDFAPPAPAGRSGWRLGRPDLVVSMPAPFKVPAAGALPYQTYRVPTGLTREHWVRAAEVRPGNPALVHHVLVWGVPPGTGLTVERGLLGSYLPGDEPELLPPGYARRLPAGCEIAFMVHYNPVGKAGADRTEIGLYFADGPVTHAVTTVNVEDGGFVVPAGAPDHEVRAWRPLVPGSEVLALTPHMHLRGKDFAVEAVHADGRRERLLSVPRYDFNWQTTYRLAEPWRVPAGTRVECVAHFDNSPANPNNPAPDREVRRGEQTTDEMMIGFVDYALPLAAPVAASPPEQRGLPAGGFVGLAAVACAVGWLVLRSRWATPA